MIIDGEEYACEGMVGPYSFNQILVEELKSYFALSNSTALKLEKKAVLETAFCLISYAIPPAEFGKRIRSGELCVVPSGYSRHALSIVFFDGVMFVCDSNRDPDAEEKACFPILNSEISDDDVDKLIKLKLLYSVEEDAREYIYKELPKKLESIDNNEKMKEGLINLEKEINSYFDKFNFKSGACAYQSFIFSLFISFMIVFKDDKLSFFDPSISQNALDGFVQALNFIGFVLKNTISKWQSYPALTQNNEHLIRKANELLERFQDSDEGSSSEPESI